LISIPRFYFDEENQFTFESITTNAWRVNHLCAVFGSLAAGFISLSTLSLLKRYRYPIRCAPSLIAGFLFAFSPLVWEHSIGAEVFSLNNLLCALLIYLTIIIYHSLPLSSSSISSSQPLLLILLGAFVSGLCLSNQHASLLLLIVLIPFILIITFPSSLTIHYLLSSSLAFLLALSFYLYLMFAALHPSPGSWGDTSTPRGLLRHFLRSEYGTFQLGIRAGSEGFVERVLLYLQHSFSSGLYFNFLAIFAVFAIFTRSPLRFSSLASNQKKLLRKPTERSAAATGTGRDKSSSLTKRSGKKIQGKVETSPVAAAHPVDASSSSDEKLISTVPVSPPLEVLCLLVSWTAYVLIWHGVLSNIPLSSPMPYGVHARCASISLTF
jgi:hypothetical protein